MASDEFLLVVLLFVFIGLMFWFVLQKQNSLGKIRIQRVESINRLIEKFSTAKEVTEFLETESGSKLIDDPAPDARNTRTQVLRFVQAGVVFLFVGVGFFLNAYRIRNETDINYVRQVLDLQYWSIFSIAIGVGLLFVAFLTSWFVRKWGINGSHH